MDKLACRCFNVNMRSLRGFEEALYFLSLTCRRLLEGLKLGLDPEFFEARFLDEVDFLDSILNRLEEALLAQTQLIQRKEYLHELLTTRQLFKEVLSEMLRQARDQTAFLGQIPMLQTLAQRNADRLDALAAEIDASPQGPGPSEVITEEEMGILLKDPDPPRR